jgi:hypothetical protein
MQLTLEIEENQFDTFLRFIKTLDYISIKKPNDFEIPQWQQDIVMERVNSNEKNISEAEFFNIIESKMNE